MLVPIKSWGTYLLTTMADQAETGNFINADHVEKLDTYPKKYRGQAHCHRHLFCQIGG